MTPISGNPRGSGGACLAAPKSESIEDSGAFVGYSAFIYSGGTFQHLNSLIPAGSGYQLDDATAINDNGQVVVNAYDTVTNQNRALLLSPS